MDLVTSVLYDGQCRACWSHFLMLVVSFTEAKSYEGVYSFSGQWATHVSPKPNNTCNKTLCLALEYIETCWSRVLFVVFGCLDGQIWVQQNLTAHKRLLIQGICAPSFVAIVRCDWAMRLLGIWSADHTPFLYPVTLIAQSILLGVSPL